MSSSDIVLTNKHPEIPKADFAFCIDFKKGEGSASRVFSATHEFIKACEHLDRKLITSIDANIETVMVLEDIEAGSLKTWLRNKITAIDDKDLKNLNWKPIVGQFLVDAKYCVLNWINEEGDEPRDLVSLSEEIQDQAAKTDVRHIPAYTPISPSDLIKAVKDFENVKEILSEEDKASFITLDREVEINLRIKLDIENIEALAVKETQTYPISSIILIVKKPDYLGSSMWELRLGQKPISAKIEDVKWLQDFQSRKINVRPGDALRCSVRHEISYGYDNELVREKFYVEKVHNVEENRYHRQATLFTEEEDKE